MSCYYIAFARLGSLTCSLGSTRHLFTPGALLDSRAQWPKAEQIGRRHHRHTTHHDHTLHDHRPHLSTAYKKVALTMRCVSVVRDIASGAHRHRHRAVIQTLLIRSSCSDIFAFDLARVRSWELIENTRIENGRVKVPVETHSGRPNNWSFVKGTTVHGIFGTLPVFLARRKPVNSITDERQHWIYSVDDDSDCEFSCVNKSTSKLFECCAITVVIASNDCHLYTYRVQWFSIGEFIIVI